MSNTADVVDLFVIGGGVMGPVQRATRQVAGCPSSCAKGRSRGGSARARQACMAACAIWNIMNFGWFKKLMSARCCSGGAAYYLADALLSHSPKTGWHGWSGSDRFSTTTLAAANGCREEDA